MKDYQRIEQQKRDKGAQVYEDWLRSDKGSLFDLYERDLFFRLVQLHSPRSVIDVGSGTGRIAETLAPLVTRVVGVDFSSNSLQVLRRKEIRNCSAVCANMAELPIRDESFDVATCCQVLPMVQEDELLVILGELRRILEPKGKLIFSVYNYHYWLHRDSGEREDFPHRRFSRKSVYSLARKFDFDVKQIGYYKAFPLRLFRQKRWIGVDRLACSVPYLNRIASAYLVAVFQKRG